MRLIDYLLAAGLVGDPHTAQGLIMRGDVLVDERPVTSPGYKVPTKANVRLRQSQVTDVSKGAAKLRPVAQRCALDCEGRVCLDLGVSTGGFTQVLLERGAMKVYAVDVGYGVTAMQLRTDPRVVLLERTNARLLSTAAVPDPVEVAVGDLSFISWAAVLPAVSPLLSERAVLLLLVKPQFELSAAGKGHLLDGGILRDHHAERECMLALYNVWMNNGLFAAAVYPAAVTGAKGNQEYFVLLHASPCEISADDYAEMVNTALAEVGR